MHGPVCKKCGHWLPRLAWNTLDRMQACRACRNLTLHFDAACMLGAYQGTWRRVVLAYKIQPSPWLAGQLAHFALCRLRAQGLQKKWAGVTPVPVRFRSRTPAAVEMLARQVAQQLQVQFEPMLVFRRPTQIQHTLSRKNRWQNMQQSLGVLPGKKIKGNWLVVDDIYTTGATVSECARTLKAAGAEGVDVLTLARGLDWRVGVL